MKDINLIRKITWSFHTSTGIEWNELFQEAALAYCKSLKTYQQKRGKLSTHAYNCIRNHLIDFTKKQTRWNLKISLDEINPNNYHAPYDEIFENLTSDAKKILKILKNKTIIFRFPKSQIQKRISNLLINKHGFTYQEVQRGLHDIELAIKTIK